MKKSKFTYHLNINTEWYVVKTISMPSFGLMGMDNYIKTENGCIITKTRGSCFEFYAPEEGIYTPLKHEEIILETRQENEVLARWIFHQASVERDTFEEDVIRIVPECLEYIKLKDFLEV